MTKVRILVAMLLCLGIAASQEPETPDTDGIPGISFGRLEALRAEIGLNERQLERLREIEFAREDALFPYAREAFEKEWALRRELRATQLNEQALRMIGEDLERIHGEIERVNTEYRAAARALLSSHQNAALDRVARAFESLQAAQEAIRVNLIEPPPGFPVGLLPFGPFGLGGFSLFGGLFGFLLDQPDEPSTVLDGIREGR